MIHDVTNVAHTHELMASEALALSAISETPAKVLGAEIHDLETYQDFTEQGTAVKGGSAHDRIWTDKSYVPITLATQCIDCLSCVGACPHHTIDYQIQDQKTSALLRAANKAASLTKLARSAPENPGVPLAMSLGFTSSAMGTFFMCTFKIASRPKISGNGTTT